MSVKILADYIEKRKIEVLTKSTEEIYDRLPPWVNEALVRSTIPKKFFSDFSEKDDIYGYDRLAVAVIIVVSGQAIPETLWGILEELLSEEALEMLHFIERYFQEF